MNGMPGFTMAGVMNGMTVLAVFGIDVQLCLRSLRWYDETTPR